MKKKEKQKSLPQQAKASNQKQSKKEKVFSGRDSLEFLAANRILNYMGNNNVSIATNFEQQDLLAKALKSEFGGDLGRSLLHRFLAYESIYNLEATDRSYNLADDGFPKGVGMGCVIQMAEEVNFRFASFTREQKTRLADMKARYILEANSVFVRLNLFNNCREIKWSSDKWRRIEDKDLCVIYIRLLSKMYNKADCDDWLTVLALENQIDPVKAYLESLEPINGEEHISQLANTIESAEPHTTHTLLRRWLIGLVASLLEVNQANENVLVFVGKQGLGKTQWAKRLLPNELQQYFATKNLTPGNKDDELMLGEFVLILMDELSSILTRKASNEAFKEMLSLDKVTHRKPYAREVSSHVRKASIIGTSNESEFLKDETGNRRFFPIYAIKIDYQHQVDVSKVFAELYQLYKQGERGHLLPHERKMLDSHNRNFEATNPYTEYIMKFCRESETEFLTCVELINLINATTKSSPQDTGKELIPPQYAAQVGRILKSMGFKQRSRSILGKTKRLYGIEFNKDGFEDFFEKPKVVSPLFDEMSEEEKKAKGYSTQEEINEVIEEMSKAKDQNKDKE
ncbi:MAG: VapE family protein [Reichenbachiella sp.]|uniref:VapE domain-containing protein n=1 Tax=Reichenbachiella sp. TaxID=2184521 RepID=UPI002966C7B5|nr:VapE domain-containing protein [Reichenbachiella sp.]MDW3208923.1 VapE family protein [Reichenbachiella sp.]